jgi:hypothetical protein
VPPVAKAAAVAIKSFGPVSFDSTPEYAMQGKKDHHFRAISV